MSDGFFLLRPLWLLLLPLLGYLLWRLWQRQQRHGQWQQLLPRALQPWLLEHSHSGRQRLPWVLLGLGWLLAGLALLGPSGERLSHNELKRHDPLVIILDMTPRMLAADLTPNRLQQARHKIADLLQLRGDAQTALVVYAGSAHSVVPLSDDLNTSLNLLDALHPDIMPRAGQRADLAIGKAQQLLEQGANGAGRLLLLTAELSTQEQLGIRQRLGRNSQKLLILGLGSQAGAPIPDSQGGLRKDAQGAIQLTRLDATGLQALAEAVAGRYTNLQLGNSDLIALGLLDSGGQLRHRGEQLRLDVWLDHGHWLLLPLLLLAACAARRGWLFILPVGLLLAPPAQAMNWEDLWLRADQQGIRLLRQGQPAQAAQRFIDPQWQGHALYQAGDYVAAAQRFALGQHAADHYNRGNALARNGDLEAALDAYETALEIDGKLSVALHNKQLVEQVLALRRQQDTQASPPSDPPTPTANEPSTAGTPAQPAQETDRPTQQGSPAQNATEPGAADESTGPGPQADSLAPGATGPENGAALGQASSTPASREQQQALEQWLRDVPDDPAELLRRKFWYQQQHAEEAQP